MRELKRKWQRFVVVIVALVAFLPTQAQRLPGQRLPTPGVTANAVLPVTIEIVGACSVSATDLLFGTYASNSTTAVRGQTAISLHCSAGDTVEISLDGGLAPGNQKERRQMRQEAGNDRLDYGLYQDAGRTIYWGDRAGVDTLAVETTGLPQTVPVYGEIPAQQRVRDGTYSDTITVTVFF
jgi:spore coat protein U-like protein